MNDLIDSKNDKELLQSLIAETAKATAELRSARADIEKVQKRIQFILMLAHKLIERNED
jgi:hypothetical protein